MATAEFHLQDNGGRSIAVIRVERVENGETVEYMVQEEMEQVVREMTQDRFTLASSSPLCNGLLGKQLGYIADTSIAQQIQEGTFEPPAGVSDATILVLEMIGNIAKHLVGGSVRLTFLLEEFTRYWRGVTERRVLWS